MVFHSVSSPLSQPGEKQLARKRNENYTLSLLKFDQIFSAIPKYKLFFGEKMDLWAKLTENHNFVETEADLSRSE